MTKDSDKNPKPPKYQPKALAALKRSAKQALELARQTNTPCWIMVGDKIVDATKLPRESQEKTKKKRTAKRD